MTGQIYIPSNPADAAKIAAVIEDISNAMTMVEAKRDYIKEAKKALKDDWDIPLDAIGTMIRLYHAQTSAEYFSKQEDLEALYDTLFRPNATANGVV